MTCFHPIHGFRGTDGRLVVVRGKSTLRVPLTVPCGRCIGCRMARSKEWATRIQHEASLHEENSFLTLTFSDENLPDDYSISVRTLQLFLKRLRKAIEPIKIRFYACGEYGDKTLRPHYHLIIFGYGFPDKIPFRRTEGGYLQFKSELLERAWPYGHADIGTVTPQSGGYVARYVIKKIGGAPAADHYTRLHPLTGEIVQVEPEFATMSSRPGIGGEWFNQFEGDAFPSDFVISDGKKTPVPNYYRNKLKDRYQNKGSDQTSLVRRDDLAPIIRKRKTKAKELAANNTPERLGVREESAQLKLNRLKRDLE